MDVVDDLGEDAGPVDAVDGAETVGAVDFWVGEEGFDDVLACKSVSVMIMSEPGVAAYLTIVECSLDCKVVHILVQHSRHLRFLYRADLALGVHNENADILLAAQTIDGCRASVTARRANDSQVLSARVLLALVPPHKEVLKQIAQKLQGHILERKRRPMEQLQQMQVLLLVQRHQRTDILRAEGAIALLNDLPQILLRDLFARDVQTEDLKGQVLEGVVAPFRLPVGGEGGDFFGDEEAAVGG